MKKMLLMALFVAGFALALTGCGGGDEDDDDRPSYGGDSTGGNTSGGNTSGSSTVTLEVGWLCNGIRCSATTHNVAKVQILYASSEYSFKNGDYKYWDPDYTSQYTGVQISNFSTGSYFFVVAGLDWSDNVISGCSSQISITTSDHQFTCDMKI